MAINLLLAKAEKYANIHRQAWENPAKLGEVKKAITDDDGNLCVLYDNGRWYHYRETNGKLEWW
jgi:hypothetical protein